MKKKKNKAVTAVWVILKSHHGEAELKPSEVRASAKIVRDESRFGNRTSNTWGKLIFYYDILLPFQYMQTYV